MTSPVTRVGIVMGSDSDWPVMEAAGQALAEFGIAYEVKVSSAHRLPHATLEYGETAAARGLQVIIAGAGGAAHLPGVLAAATALPVIGVPVPLKQLDGLDSLLSIVQMPAGVPVATVGVGAARNAGLLAVRILGATDEGLRAQIVEFQGVLAEQVRAKDAALQRLIAAAELTAARARGSAGEVDRHRDVEEHGLACGSRGRVCVRRRRNASSGNRDDREQRISEGVLGLDMRRAHELEHRFDAAVSTQRDPDNGREPERGGIAFADGGAQAGETRQDPAGLQVKDRGHDAAAGAEVGGGGRGFEIGELGAGVVPRTSRAPALRRGRPDVADRPAGGLAHQRDGFVVAQERTLGALPAAACSASAARIAVAWTADAAARAASTRADARPVVDAVIHGNHVTALQSARRWRCCTAGRRLMRAPDRGVRAAAIGCAGRCP